MLSTSCPEHTHTHTARIIPNSAILSVACVLFLALLFNSSSFAQTVSYSVAWPGGANTGTPVITITSDATGALTLVHIKAAIAEAYPTTTAYSEAHSLVIKGDFERFAASAVLQAGITEFTVDAAAMVVPNAIATNIFPASCVDLKKITMNNAIPTWYAGFTTGIAQLTALEELSFPNLTAANWSLNGATKLTKLNLGKTTTIPANALNGTTALKSITLPATVTSIPSGAFNGSSANTITFLGSTPPTVDAGAFTTMSTAANVKIAVPASAVAAYKTALATATGITVTNIVATYRTIVKAGPGGSVASTEHGTIPATGIDLPEGTEINLTAAANQDYELVSWTKNGAVITGQSNNTYKITVAGNDTYMANFATQCDITAAVNGTGGGTNPYAKELPSGTGNTATANDVAAGSQVELSVTASPCYVLTNWTNSAGNIVGTTATCTLTVTKTDTYTANFEKEQIPVATAGNGGTIGGETTAYAECGASGVILTAEPAEGFTFLKWVNAADGTVPTTGATVTDNKLTISGAISKGGATYRALFKVTPRIGNITVKNGGKVRVGKQAPAPSP